MDLEKTERRFGTEISTLQDENAGIRKDIAKNDQAIADIRKRIADISADMTEIRAALDKLKGEYEVLGKTEFLRKDKEFADMKSHFDQLYSRMTAIENLLEMGSSANRTPEGDKIVSDDSKKAVPGKADKESAYNLAYEAFKEEKYEKAREGFQSFLKQYPNTGYSDSAQFWIGESYYFERKYELAILEYEKMIKDYPQSNKVPHALLKQGFSFLNMGDKASAKVLLEQVAKNYPGTNHARMSRAKLKEIK
jgi:tol-pal system protein YbgF